MVVHCVDVSKSATSIRPQPWFCRAYMPVNGVPLAPTICAAVRVLAPSEPPLNVQVAAAGAVVPDPAVARISCDLPRRTPVPLLMAAASATQKALPVPVMLSYSSGWPDPGTPTIAFQLPAWDPFVSCTVR